MKCSHPSSFGKRGEKAVNSTSTPLVESVMQKIMKQEKVYKEPLKPFSRLQIPFWWPQKRTAIVFVPLAIACVALIAIGLVTGYPFGFQSNHMGGRSSSQPSNPPAPIEWEVQPGQTLLTKGQFALSIKSISLNSKEILFF